MKRIGNIYHKITSLDNLKEADQKAQKGNQGQYGVQLHNRAKETNLEALRQMLVTKTYRTSTYDIFKVYEPKEREVYRLPIVVIAYKIEPSKVKESTELLTLQIEKGGEKRIVFTGSTVLIDQIKRVGEQQFPFETVIKGDNDYYEFT